MKLLGLTGGVGAGKSAAAELWRKRGWPAVDTDDIARDLTRPGGKAWEEIVGAFGEGCLLPDRSLNRKKLAETVFSDAAARARLEGILHPRIREQWLAQAGTWRRDGVEKGMVVIPLLFETGAGAFFDKTVCVACLAATQRSRLRARGWDDEEVEKRIAAQWPMAEKMNLADHVIWNESTPGVLDQQMEWISRH